MRNTSFSEIGNVLIVIENNITIESVSIINSSSDTTFLDLTDSSFTMKDTNISNGKSQKGGAIRIKKNLNESLPITILNCRFVNNTATLSGGAIYMEGLGITITISNCTFVNNIAKEAGPNIYQLTTALSDEVLVLMFDNLDNLSNFITINNKLLKEELSLTYVETNLSL